jgi:hypothetical protein
MRKIIILLLACVGSFQLMYARETVNPVLGDISFLDRFGYRPDKSTNENLRITTHLAYVENLLRSATTSQLSPSQKINREKILNLLHQYRLAGEFPTNVAYPNERRPCFIDDAGNICAVGYLVEQTVGREVSEQINTRNQYENIYDMDADIIQLIEIWAKENGLTLEECAMIQPAYGPPPPDEITAAPLKTSYAASSAVLGGMNIGLGIVNMTHKPSGNYKFTHYAGLVTGSAQLILGVANIKKDRRRYDWGGGMQVTTYKAQNNVSYANIVVGSTTLVTSALNLIIHNKMKHSKNAVAFYTDPYYKSAGVTLTKKL